MSIAPVQVQVQVHSSVLNSVLGSIIVGQMYSTFALVLLFFSIAEVRPRDFVNNENGEADYHKGCAYLHCDDGDRCVHRKFRCKNQPCPSMLYCAKSRTESLRGPSTCDTVRCSRGYVCVVKVHRCRWDEKCKQQIARCISRKEYYEGPASCAGFKCPAGKHCVLRESLCVSPPCKLLKSCATNRDTQIWFGRCRSLGCPSEFECFLRRPAKDCTNQSCTHTPDCIATTPGEVANGHCHGWICPRMQTCAFQIMGSCNKDECDIKRSCNETQVLSGNNSVYFSRSLVNKDETPLNDGQVNDQSMTKKNVPEIENESVLREYEKRRGEIPSGRKEVATGEEPRNANQENLNEEITNEKWRSLTSWLNHLRSKTELDAVELWIKNAEKERDFEHFQDWLRSVKDILGSNAYERWLEEIYTSSSRSKEFQEWIREASATRLLEIGRDKSNVESKVLAFPETRREQTGVDIPAFLAKDRFSFYDTATRSLTNPLLSFGDVENKREYEVSNGKPEVEKIITGKQDLADVIRNLIIPHTILLPPYNALEVAVLDHLRKPNYIPLSYYDLKYPSLRDERILSPYLSKMKSIYGQSYSLPPFDDTKFLPGSDSRMNSQNRGSRNWTSSQEIMPGNFESIDRNVNTVKFNSHALSRNEQPIHDYDWSPLSQMYKHANLPVTENFQEIVERSSSSDGKLQEFNAGFSGEFDNTFFSNAGQTQDSSFSRHSNNSNRSILQLEEDTDEDDDDIDQKSLIEANEENILPYVKALIEAISEDYDISSNTELYSDESATKDTYTFADIRDASEILDKMPTLAEKRENISANENLTNNKNSRFNLESNPITLESKTINKISEAQTATISPSTQANQEKVSRTSHLIYGDTRNVIRSVYNIWSYGAGDGKDISNGDYKYDANESNLVSRNYMKDEGGNDKPIVHADRY